MLQKPHRCPIRDPLRASDTDRRDNRVAVYDERGRWSPWCLALTMCCVLTGLSLTTRGFAADFELQGGFSTDVGNSTYSFLEFGVETPLVEKVGFLAQLTTSFLTFKSREEDKTIWAEAPAATELIGLRYHLTDTTTVSLLAGGQEKETRFFGAQPRFRNDNGFVTKAEFYSQLTPSTELVILYRFSVAEASHYALVTAKHGVFRFGSRKQFSFDLGIEASAALSTDFNEEQAALLVGVTHRPTNTSLQLGVGAARFTSSGERGIVPYVGVSFFANF